MERWASPMMPVVCSVRYDKLGAYRKVKCGNVLSHTFGSLNGLRQVGILSPYLFNTYTDALNVKLKSLPFGCPANETTIKKLGYADDMVLISPSVQGLQRLIDTCRQYAEKFDILYNGTRTQCMSLLPRSLKHIAEPQIFLGNHRLEVAHEFPYLGHIITKDLKDAADMEQRRRKPRARQIGFFPVKYLTELCLGKDTTIRLGTYGTYIDVQELVVSVNNS
ncbi:uncharacterized protein LOC135196616 [Macrobrachium nipponense]|uniref:uncharacterized protein LOC135196616 n=1 Tax=Macrobrachium nipponense TaxID=159736 RepID=UPI0030C8C342